MFTEVLLYETVSLFLVLFRYFHIYTSKSKRCYGNSNVKALLYSLSSDIFNIVPIQCHEKETN